MIIQTLQVSLDSFEIGGKVWRQEERKGVKTQTINLDATQFVPAPREEVKLFQNKVHQKSLVGVRKELRVINLDRLFLRTLLDL